ncbi:sigma-70 family RNA polymerase sigma factor [Nocardia higoensis]|uniref:sigma-70 family RNA polymerase sigma factor n=1 Tax=Nocardia higoensis TaxID=228599 RepID=UPI0012F66CBF|nr:sigma-70 family RNA polymerase sigma factor [Nocardia higoensis]
MAIGERSANNSRRPIDSHRGIEAISTALAQKPPDSAEARALREQLIRRCLPLGEHIARRYSGHGDTYDDLFQAASLAIALAVDSFDPLRDKPFVAFLVPEILGAVRRRSRDQTYAMKVVRRLQEIRAKITPTVDAMTHRLARVPTAAEVAGELDADVQEVTHALLANSGYRSRAATTRPEIVTIADRTTSGTLDEAEDPGYELVMQEVVASRVLATLSETERWVVYLRFFRRRPPARIAAQLGVSPIQVSWILSRALATIRESTPRP